MTAVLRRMSRIALILTVVLVLGVVAFLFYTSMVMQGERGAALKAWNNPAIQITSTDYSIVMTPRDLPSGSGLVFIPGAKVDPYAYLYKLSGIVEFHGITVVITKPTLNLAFFDQRSLAFFHSDAPEVTRWFVGGHSLGGVRACQLAGEKTSEESDTQADIAGVVLFASYCANDLSGSDRAVLSLGASADRLSTPEKIRDASVLLPTTTRFVEIEGMNHSGFGDYGTQPGDGTSSLSSTQQRDLITRYLASFLAGSAD
ncbi:MAG: alpha/beta hydrolase [Rhodoglobus sp.]